MIKQKIAGIALGFVLIFVQIYTVIQDAKVGENIWDTPGYLSGSSAQITHDLLYSFGYLFFGIAGVIFLIVALVGLIIAVVRHTNENMEKSKPAQLVLGTILILMQLLSVSGIMNTSGSVWAAVGSLSVTVSFFSDLTFLIKYCFTGFIGMAFIIAGISGQQKMPADTAQSGGNKRQ